MKSVSDIYYPFILRNAACHDLLPVAMLLSASRMGTYGCLGSSSLKDLQSKEIY
jgi:hypothetical protein